MGRGVSVKFRHQKLAFSLGHESFGQRMVVGHENCVVADGVETEEQLRYLSEHGCDLMQGYLLSRPVSERHALEYVENHQAERRPDLGLIS